MKYMYYTRKQFKHKILARAFTLIELLVVVSIIGVLSTVILAALQAARNKANDAKRFSDLRQMEKALDTYYADNGKYPGSSDANCNGTGSTKYCTACSGTSVSGIFYTDTTALSALVPNYIPSIPNGPQANGNASGGVADCYAYATNSSGSDYNFGDFYPSSNGATGKSPSASGSTGSFYNSFRSDWAVWSSGGSSF